MQTENTSTDAVTVAQSEDPEEWDSFVVENGGPPMALWGWGDAVEVYDHDRWYLEARSDSDLVGVLPLFRMRSRLFGDKLVSVPFTSRGSAVLGDDRPDAAKRALLDRTRELADELGVDFVSLRANDLGDCPRFTRRNRFLAFHVDVDRDPDAVWDGLKPSRQRAVRQARENDAVEFDVGDSVDDLREYYDLYLESMRGHGSPPHSFEFFETLWDRLYEDGHLRLGLVREEGSLINGVIDLAAGTTVVQKGVVSDYERRDLNGGSLVSWRSLKWASDQGYETYDFGRTREGSGVYMFKKSFGGEKVWLDDYHYFPDGEVDLPDSEDEKFDLPKRIWRRLPIAVTRTVGPTLRKDISL